MINIQKSKKLLTILFIVLGVLIISFIALGVFAVKNRKVIYTNPIEAIVETNILNENIYIQDVNVSSMDEPSARAALKPVVENWYYGKDVAFAVDNKGYQYNIRELGAEPDIDKAIKQAFDYSASDTLPEGVTKSADGSVNFKIEATITLADVMTFLQSEEVANEINIPPSDDGINFKPRALDEEERFTYQEPTPGIKINTEEFASEILNTIETDDYSSIIHAPTTVVQSFTSIEDMKQNTQPIGTYTSDIKIRGENRDKNVTRMAQLLCENMPVIYPGEQLSLNGVAGMRTAENGFFEAPGLTSGVHDLQYGGGVCQVSSTVYIAALAAELQIDERHHHSLPSSYIPVGLDATISEKPDLKITNNKTYPIYMSIVVDLEARTCTCTFYGKPAGHGYDVEITNKLYKTTMPSPPSYDYATETPGGTAIKPGTVYEYIEHTYGQRVNVYRQYKDSEGNVVKSELLYPDIYDAFSGVYYVNPNEEG